MRQVYAVYRLIDRCEIEYPPVRIFDDWDEASRWTEEMKGKDGYMVSVEHTMRREPRMNDKHLWICDGENYLDNDGNLVTIHYDYDCDSPRDELNIGTFVTWLRRHNSPDSYSGDFEHFRADMDLEDEHDELTAPYWDAYYDYQMETYRINGIRHQNELHGNLIKKLRYWRGALYNPSVTYMPVPDMPTPPTYPIKNELTWVIDKMNERGMYALPVSVYEHSGTVYRVGDDGEFVDGMWDAGYAGLIYTTDECIQRFGNTNYTREQVYEWLKGEVDYYSEWADGHCFWFEVTDRNGDTIDSCGGFIGDDAYENGIIDHIGELHECSFRDVDEYLEFVEEVNETAEDILDGMAAANEDYAA